MLQSTFNVPNLNIFLYFIYRLQQFEKPVNLKMKFVKSKKIVNAKKKKRNSANSHSKNVLPCLAVKEFNEKKTLVHTEILKIRFTYNVSKMHFFWTDQATIITKKISNKKSNLYYQYIYSTLFQHFLEKTKFRNLNWAKGTKKRMNICLLK